VSELQAMLEDWETSGAAAVAAKLIKKFAEDDELFLEDLKKLLAVVRNAKQ